MSRKAKPDFRHWTEWDFESTCEAEAALMAQIEIQRCLESRGLDRELVESLEIRFSKIALVLDSHETERGLYHPFGDGDPFWHMEIMSQNQYMRGIVFTMLFAWQHFENETRKGQDAPKSLFNKVSSYDDDDDDLSATDPAGFTHAFRCSLGLKVAQIVSGILSTIEGEIAMRRRAEERFGKRYNNNIDPPLEP